MLKDWSDKVNKLNGIGVLFRFITPTLVVTIGVFIITCFRADLSQVRSEAKANFDKLQAVAQVNFDKIDLQLSNHLAHHQVFDKEIFERLTCLETILKKNGK